MTAILYKLDGDGNVSRLRSLTTELLLKKLGTSNHKKFTLM